MEYCTFINRYDNLEKRASARVRKEYAQHALQTKSTQVVVCCHISVLLDSFDVGRMFRR